ncbi:MAG TPA: hypothetical protein VHT91_21335 [Kofleriaceae bacterium]|jgi:hypothetical protein|nr:hypothetical protein [Kofleriaceae bacterium]
MRRLSAAIAVSVTGHLVAIAWITGADVLAVPLRARPASATVTPAPPEAISLVLLDPHDERADVPPSAVREVPPTPSPPRRPAVPGGRPATSTGAPNAAERSGAAPAISTGVAAPGERPGAAPGHSPWMTLRPPAVPPPTGLSPEFVRRFLDHSRPLVPQPSIPDEDSAADLAGEPDIHDQIVAADHGATWRRIARAEFRARTEELKPAAGGGYQADKPTFTARIDAGGTAHLEDKPWELDAQDYLMKRHGIDPYARAKLAFLDRTRDQRAAIGARHAREQLARSPALMQNNIDRLWATTRDLAARKQGLFELWDDCAETGSDELVAGGAAARAIVTGVIRARLRGGDAYSAAELARLNAIRHSTAVFAPYDDAPPPAP